MTSSNSKLNNFLEVAKVFNAMHADKKITQLEALKAFLFSEYPNLTKTE